ncbi:hypothetical protein [Shimia sp. MMG029]|uniref:hypothetical protein n=1 Tax=Shimia sp. MMG029 TaxID=3021978 RepID=UPI0022FE0A2F|nr:hypothetical protein [Shimia sp. MMG029]MDA5555340.1 hypothetical protein [Shimia sp. MMG029]
MKPIYAALCIAGLTLAACGQQEEPAPINVQPTFNKAGDASCPGGYELQSTETGALLCAPIVAG